MTGSAILAFTDPIGKHTGMLLPMELIIVQAFDTLALSWRKLAFRPCLMTAKCLPVSSDAKAIFQP